MSFPFHPIATTSDTEPDDKARQQGPKTYVDSDFADAEDAIPWWRSLTVAGGLLFLDGYILWWLVFGVGVGTNTATLSVALGGAFAIALVGLAVAAIGFGAESLAFFAAGILGVALTLAVTGSGNPAGGPLSVGADLILLIGVFVAGCALIVVGLVRLTKLYRMLAAEEKGSLVAAG
ncbi:MAG: hypothetical protein WCB18_01320 [Thermoplasmata archaeon]